MPLKSRIRTIPNYPKPGIQFRDITTLLQDPFGFRELVDDLVQPFAGERIDAVAGVAVGSDRDGIIRSTCRSASPTTKLSEATGEPSAPILCTWA